MIFRLDGNITEKRYCANSCAFLCPSITDLTRYSMYGKFCADYRGYGNGNAALGAMVNSIGGNAYPFSVSDEEKNWEILYKIGGARRRIVAQKERGNSWRTKRLVYSIQDWQLFTRMEWWWRCCKQWCWWIGSTVAG